MERAEKLYRTSDIARFCAVKNDTAQKWLAHGKIPSVRTAGGQFRIKESDLVKFLKSLNISVPGLTFDIRKTRILIAEDEPAPRRLMVRLVEQSVPDCEIFEAITGYEAGFMTRDLRPDLVILDLVLPGIHGARVCRIIRKNKDLKATRILAVTAYHHEKARRVLLKAGADAFMEKPFSNGEFIDTVTRLAGVKTKGHKLSVGN